MDQKAMFKQLDDAEERLLASWDSWLDGAFRSIPWKELERLKKTGSGPKVLSRLPPLITTDAGSLARMLADHGAEMVAAGMAHGELLAEECRKHRSPNRKFADLPGFDFVYGEEPRLIPEKAIAAMEARALSLTGDVDADLTSQVKKALVRYLAGTSRRETEDTLQGILKSSRDRASNITTTETTYSYNRGRLASYAENRVDYVRFSAVMDGRTSPVCRSRHGLIMRMDDPRISGNTPPLHGRCRSVLDPLYSFFQGELITDDALNWDNVAPLPKGWKSAT